MSISGIISSAERQDDGSIKIELQPMPGPMADPVGQSRMTILAPCNMISVGAKIWGGGDFCLIKLDDGSWGEYEREGYVNLRQKSDKDA
jgi:hypothetical protein